MRLERETSDKDRRLAARLSGLIFAFFSLEAYLNHLGRKTSPDIWEGEKEREYFSGRKKIDGHRYSGPTGKLQFLYSKCGLFYDENSEEMRTIRKLKQFRDILVHGKTEEAVLPVSCRPDEIPELIVPEVWQYVQGGLREDAYLHGRNVIERLHKAALAAFPDVGLETAPFMSSFFQATDVATEKGGF